VNQQPSEEKLTVKTPVYLDHNATTPIDPRVLDFLQNVQRDHYGNPASSSHAHGWAAAKLVEQARQQVADLIGATPREIIFTSGATESNNLALLGLAAAHRGQGGGLVTTVLEHEAVAGPAAELAGRGWQVATVGCGADGVVDLAQLDAAMGANTFLVSVMAAQNEIGTIQPVTEIGARCKARGVLFHCDAAQAVGKIPLDVNLAGIDLLSVSSHKLYGPKGVGALFLRRRDPRVTISPTHFGGGQERGLRPGTLNVPGIAAFGEACRLAGQEMETEGRRLLALRERLWSILTGKISGVRLNGCPRRRLPGNLNVSFEGVRAHTLLGKLTTLSLSSSSACSSAESGPSPILLQLGLEENLASASLRIGLGRFTTGEEVDFAADKIARVVAAVR
jgi:cysteine desulfurase